MSQLALYRAWRPQTFDDVVAQKQVVYPLKQAIISGEIGHAYLFSGTRGTGKTSLAKIFAKAVNCLNPHDGNPCNECSICKGINNGSLLDVMEIDAASHNSVDNIRRITGEVVFMPTEARYKVYIIDEVHMLSQGAFNALLKTLEEPPAHVIFILATTEPQRIPATILSRCQRFEFRRIPLEDIESRLRAIAEADNIPITEEAIYTIARLGDGALRDAISLLDQCSSGLEGKITHDAVLTIAGVVPDDFLAGFCRGILTGNLMVVLESIDDLQMSGRSLPRFLQDFLAYLRDLLVVSLGKEATQLLNQTQAGIKDLQALAELTDRTEIMAMIGRLSKLNNELRWSQDPKTTMELAFIAEVALHNTTETEANIRPSTAISATAQPKTAKSNTTKAETVAPIAGSEARVAKSAAPERPAPATAVPEETAEPVKPASLPSKEDLPQVEFRKAHEEQTGYRQSSQPTNAVTDKAAREAKKAAHPSDFEASKNTDSADNFGNSGSSKRTGSATKLGDNTSPRGTGIADSTGNTGEVSDSDSPLWQAILDELRNRSRYDMVMLIKPAQIKISESKIKVVYDRDHKAHYETMSRAENVEVLTQAALKAGLASAQVEFVLTPNEEEDDQGNGNSREPLWVRKLRHASEVHGLKFRLEDDKQ